MRTFNYLKTVMLLMAIMPSVAQAQFALGAKVGMNSSTQANLGQLTYDNEFKVGTQAGLQVEYRFHSIFALQLEGNYISKGCKTGIDENSGGNDIIRNFDYINIPVLFKARFDDELGLSEKRRIFLYAGPYYSSLLSATDHLDSKNVSEATKIEDVAESSDYGLSFGGGLSFVLNTGNEIFLDLRYDMGLTDIISTDNSLRNKTIGLSVGYKFL
jgi:hypothetical protein